MTILACLPNTSSKLNASERWEKGSHYKFPCLSSSTAVQIKRHFIPDFFAPSRWKLQTRRPNRMGPETEAVCVRVQIQHLAARKKKREKRDNSLCNHIWPFHLCRSCYAAQPACWCLLHLVFLPFTALEGTCSFFVCLVCVPLRLFHRLFGWRRLFPWPDILACGSVRPLGQSQTSPGPLNTTGHRCRTRRLLPQIWPQIWISNGRIRPCQ